MDKKLRELERLARSSDDAEDMYKFYHQYRKIHPNNGEQIPLRQGADPRFRLPFRDYPAEIEFRSQARIITFTVEPPWTDVKAFLTDLLGTTVMSMSDGTTRNVALDAPSRSPYVPARMSAHIYVQWDEARCLKYHYSRWSEDKPTPILGSIFLPSSNRDKPSPVFDKASEDALNTTFMPWMQLWWEENYQAVLKWQKLSSEASLRYYEESLDEQRQRLQQTQQQIDETKRKLASQVFYKMQLASGEL